MSSENPNNGMVLLSGDGFSLKNTKPITLIRIGFPLVLVGFFVLLLGAKPSIFGLDRSPVIGFIQISAMLVGLGFICVGGRLTMMAHWQNRTMTIAADIGLRLVATGFLLSTFAGLADVFGLGSHPLPGVPFFGEWQARGVQIGQCIIGIGFILMIPFGRKNDPNLKTAKDLEAQ
jgi:hypothetical protein